MKKWERLKNGSDGVRIGPLKLTVDPRGSVSIRPYGLAEMGHYPFIEELPREQRNEAGRVAAVARARVILNEALAELETLDT